jgi:glyoxylase-like metal-dependent hydrolase (beta-lactamase superfamily II)
MLDIQSFYESESGTWTHLVADTVDKVAAVIDPVWVYDPVSGLADATFIENVLEVARQAGYRLEWVLETHAHADHLTAADLLRRQTGARIACGQGIRAVQKPLPPHSTCAAWRPTAASSTACSRKAT